MKTTNVLLALIFAALIALIVIEAQPRLSAVTWEYTVKGSDRQYGMKVFPFMEAYSLGEHGWELCATWVNRDGEPEFIFKRPKIQAR